MSRSKLTLSRRLLLGGGATLFGLPFLESALPRAARAQSTKSPVRLVYLFMPNGIEMGSFRPSTAGRDYELSPMLASLADIKSEFSVVSGLENKTANPVGPGDHAGGTAGFITCAPALKSETQLKVGISADQLAAQKLGAATRLPSLQLGTEAGESSGTCDSGFSCAYSLNISWIDPFTPLPKVLDPQVAFNQLFEGADPGASAAEVARRRAYDQSVIDFVLADVSGLSPKLGATDQKKLDQYLTGVRELEKRLTSMPALNPSELCPPAPLDLAGELDLPTHLRAMMDVMVLALACDATRIITFMFGHSVTGRSYPFLGITRGHHEISHHKDQVENLELLAKIGEWEMQQFGYLLRRLNEMPDAVEGQSLLYNSAIFCSSDVSDGNKHNHVDMPILLGGHAGGALHPGQHVEFTTGPGGQKERVANLLVTMLEAAGVTGAELGDSTGPLPQL